MGFSSILKGIKTICKLIHKNRTTIMVAGGIASTAAGVYFTVEATREIDKEFKVLEERKANGEKVTTPEVLRAVGKHAWKPAVCFTVGGGFIVFAHKISQGIIKDLGVELTSAYTSNYIWQEKYRRKYGDKALREFEAWDGKQEKEVISDEELALREQREAQLSNVLPPYFISGLYFQKSRAYDCSDNLYNEAWIQKHDENITNKLRNSFYGRVSFREVLEEFEFYDVIDEVDNLIRSGRYSKNYLDDRGWDMASWYGVTIERDAVDINHTSGELDEEIYIRWPRQPMLFAALDYGTTKAIKYRG